MDTATGEESPGPCREREDNDGTDSDSGISDTNHDSDHEDSENDFGFDDDLAHVKQSCVDIIPMKKANPKLCSKKMRSWSEIQKTCFSQFSPSLHFV